MDRETLLRNMELSKQITDSAIGYTYEEFASNVLGRRNIVNEGMVLRFSWMANGT